MSETRVEDTRRWRVGKSVALNVYKGDIPMFQCHTPEDAASVVYQMNLALELEQQLKTVRAERDSLEELRVAMCASLNCSGEFLARVVMENKAELAAEKQRAAALEATLANLTVALREHTPDIAVPQEAGQL